MPPSPPLYHHHSTTTTSTTPPPPPSPLHHHSTTTITPPPLPLHHHSPITPSPPPPPPPLSHCHHHYHTTAATTTMPPLHNNHSTDTTHCHHYTIITPRPPPLPLPHCRRHRYNATIAQQSLHRHNSLPSLHHHHSTATTTTIHCHHYTTITPPSLSPPLHHHQHTTTNHHSTITIRLGPALSLLCSIACDDLSLLSPSQQSTSKLQSPVAIAVAGRHRHRQLNHPIFEHCHCHRHFISDDYLKKARTAETGPRFFVSKHSSVAAEAWKNMSDAERAPFLEVANERKARTKKNVPKKKKTSALPVFRSRCSPKALVKENASLNIDQRAAVDRLGFGSLLKVQCEILKRGFISKLVHHFNPMNKTLAFGRMKVYSITPDDVGRALGLPVGTVPVKTHAKFQTSYVLFLLSSLLCPTTKDVASTKFYPAVYDLTKISSYAWPQHVLDWLVKEILKFKNRDVKDVDKKKDAPGVSGCVLLLILIYFDKEDMGMNVGRAGVPLIESWTTRLVLERIAKEENLDLVDPISAQFPEPRLLHPEAQKAFHLLKKSFIEQLESIIIMDAAMMGVASETTTQQNRSKTKDVREMDSPFDAFDADACHQFPSTSTSTPKKAMEGVGTDEIDEDRITDFGNVMNARDMVENTPENTMEDVLHTSMAAKCGSHTGLTIEKLNLNMEEEVQVEEQFVVENQGEVDVQGEQLQVQVDERVVQERAFTRPSNKRGNRTVKAGKATRIPYVAEPEVKDSKFTKQESQLVEYVMKPSRKKEDMAALVSMDGMTLKPSRTDLRNVFKERGWMSNLVIDSMIVWLMKEEKEKSPNKHGVAIPTRHMFSSTFVLFLPILLATSEHWYCVVINLVEKRIDVLDSMKLKSDEKTSATADVVSALFTILKRTRPIDYQQNNWIIHHPSVPQQINMRVPTPVTRILICEIGYSYGLYYPRTTNAEMMYCSCADKPYRMLFKLAALHSSVTAIASACYCSVAAVEILTVKADDDVLTQTAAARLCRAAELCSIVVMLSRAAGLCSIVVKQILCPRWKSSRFLLLQPSVLISVLIVAILLVVQQVLISAVCTLLQPFWELPSKVSQAASVLKLHQNCISSEACLLCCCDLFSILKKT
ncbi:hypothetical protein RHGRI_004954 [Rhododendron griersonianum]|uniref:Ubiquitin-like protease family profile domain-containing protein n=1 Tax=Rhododendron griersonianum TaxID=479676 RepID=A0AAV6LBI9_9ERIC|nr:hypothetical protein RHGRI_004954 [Rhododendron griersonianum]